MSAEQITDEQLCSEYMKYEIRKFYICFSKEKAKKARADTVTLENKSIKRVRRKPRLYFGWQLSRL